MKATQSKALYASIALALVALAWGTSYAIIKDAIQTIKPFTLMTMRFGLSTVILSALYMNKLKTIRMKDLKRGGLIGLFMFLAFVTLILGIQFTTASKQSFIIGAYVLIVPFLAWVVNNKRPDVFAIVGASLATFGIGLLTLDARLNFNIGDVLSVVTAFGFACHMITIEKYSQDSDPIVLTIIQFATTALLFIVLTGVFESYDFSAFRQSYLSIGYLVIVTTVIAFVVQNVAQRYISSTSTALILTLESAFGAVFAVFLLHETLTPQMFIGCFIIFIGIITQETKWSFLFAMKKPPSLDIVNKDQCL